MDRQEVRQIAERLSRCASALVDAIDLCVSDKMIACAVKITAIWQDKLVEMTKDIPLGD